MAKATQTKTTSKKVSITIKPKSGKKCPVCGK